MVFVVRFHSSTRLFEPHGSEAFQSKMGRPHNTWMELNEFLDKEGSLYYHMYKQAPVSTADLCFFILFGIRIADDESSCSSSSRWEDTIDDFLEGNDHITTTSVQVRLDNNSVSQKNIQPLPISTPKLHMLVKAPPNGRYSHKDGLWSSSNRQKYQTYGCRMCKKTRVRTYCVCRLAYWLCKDCHLHHMFEEHANINPTVRCNIISEKGNHQLITAPPGARSYNRTSGWNAINKDKRQKYLCRTCNKRRIRTVCDCDKTEWMCSECHGDHVGDVVIKIANTIKGNIPTSISNNLANKMQSKQEILDVTFT